MFIHKKAQPLQGRAMRKAERPQNLATMMKCVLLALPFTVLLGALLLSVCTAALLLTPNPIHYTRLSAVCCLYLTAFLCGLLATRFYGRRAPVLCGLAAGVLLALCLGLPTLFLWEDDFNAATALLLRLLIPLFSLAGALFTTRKRKTRRRRTQKR